MQLTLAARPPFSLPAVIRSHGWYQLAPFTFDEARETLGYVTQLQSGRVVALQISGVPDGVQVSLDGDLDDAEQSELGQQVIWMLGLEQDLSDFYAQAAAEPKLAHVPAGAHGRVLRSVTLFEDVVKTILTTNTAWSGTKRMVNAVVEGFGTPHPAEPERRAFPRPADLAAADELTLREAGLGYRAPYVYELAQRVAEDDVDLEAWKTADLPTPELRKRLLSLKGVGNYAAANLLMLLGRYDFIPIDSWARMVVSHEWREGEPVTAADVEAAFARWGEFKGLAFWFWNWDYYAQADA